MSWPVQLIFTGIHWQQQQPRLLRSCSCSNHGDCLHCGSPHTTRMRLKSRMVMTAHPTVISRRPTQAPSGLPEVLSAPWASAAAACLKGLPLHRQDALP